MGSSFVANTITGGWDERIVVISDNEEGGDDDKDYNTKQGDQKKKIAEEVA